MANTKKTDKQSDFQKMVKELGLTKAEIADMLGLTKEVRGKGQGKYSSYNKGGVAKKAAPKKMMRGGAATTQKKMRGGGMLKAAKKKMMRGGMAAKKRGK
jgi:hypothetical protein